MSPVIRDAAPSDLDRINTIYNFYVQHSTCTYQEEPETAESRLAWFARHGPVHPVIVAEVDGQAVGWGSLSPYHPRSAYRFTVENSVYIDDTWRGRGLGGRLLDELIARARMTGHRSIIALIDAEQPASVALHHARGFATAGHLRGVGYKFGRWLDVVHMQLILNRAS